MTKKRAVRRTCLDHLHFVMYIKKICEEPQKSVFYVTTSVYGSKFIISQQTAP